MLRAVEHRPRIAALHHLPLPHDDDAVADVVGGRQVVGDVDDRNTHVVTQLAQQVELAVQVFVLA